METADDLLPELPVPPDAGPRDEHERAARWAALNRRAQLSVHQSEGASFTLYADNPAVRLELAALAAAEAVAHPELEIGALIGDGHLVLAIEPRDGVPPDPPAPASDPRPLAAPPRRPMLDPAPPDRRLLDRPTSDAPTPD